MLVFRKIDWFCKTTKTNRTKTMMIYLIVVVSDENFSYKKYIRISILIIYFSRNSNYLINILLSQTKHCPPLQSGRTYSKIWFRKGMIPSWGNWNSHFDSSSFCESFQLVWIKKHVNVFITHERLKSIVTEKSQTIIFFYFSIWLVSKIVCSCQEWKKHSKVLSMKKRVVSMTEWMQP